ncbi:MAG: GTP cyclohydrolase MptA [Thermoplasmata archaeon]|nr:GTP cyclohydrolase MptA [Thermoplasmata archaeon]
MRDVHASTPASGHLTLDRVGIEGIRKPLLVQRADRVITLGASFAISVDLPASRKGSDLSRNAELLADTIDWPEASPVASLESACATIARDLLTRHPYASRSEVSGEAEYFLSRGRPGGRASLENFGLFASAVGSRNGGAVDVRRSIGAEAVGMTACPCAMETARSQLREEFPQLASPELEALPIVSHNQRNRTRLVLELSGVEEVEADRLVEAIEAAQSSPTYAILKRADEARVVLDAHRRPKFVEDVVRDLLASIPARFPELSDGDVARVRTTSEESIHKYNVVAEHRATFRELRALGSA